MPENTGRNQDGTFPKGVSGNPAGKPKGARHQLTENFVKALNDDFTEHGVVAIQTVRAEKPDQYLKVIASLVPKDVNLTVNNMDDMSDAELAERIQSLATTLAPFLVGGTGGADESVEGTTSADLAPRIH